MLSQYHFLLSPRKAAQLKWSRFINTKGRRGGNISCDLHLEHLNRRLKGGIRNLHSNACNVNESIYPCRAVNRVARSIGVLHDICTTFEQQNNVKAESDKHNTPSFMKDTKNVLEVLEELDVFKQEAHKKHSSFSNLNMILQQCPSHYLDKWVATKIETYKLRTY